MNGQLRTSFKFFLLACAALGVGIGVGGFPNYYLYSAARVPLNHVSSAAPRRATASVSLPVVSACFKEATALVHELRKPVEKGSPPPPHHYCERNPDSFFLKSVSDFEEAISRVRGGGESCATISAPQNGCVQLYVNFVKNQMQFCAETSADLHPLSPESTLGTRAFYCRCLAGAMNASASWITAPMLEPAPVGPYPFGEGCGFTATAPIPAQP